MEYGSIFGHGAYLGPDFTADYLHRAATIATREYGGESSDTAREQVIADFKTNRYDAETDTVTIDRRPGGGLRRARRALHGVLRAARARPRACCPTRSPTRRRSSQLTAYFAWSAWAGSTLRPDKDYTYTNNWPPEDLVGNTVTANVVVWSVLSLIVLLAGIGVLFAAFGRWGERMGWRGRQADTISFRPPGRRRGDADAAGLRLLLPRRRPALRDPDDGRGGQRALPRRPHQLLRLRPGPLAAVQPGPHLARPARHLLDRDVVPGHRPVPRADHLGPRAAPSVLARLRPAGRPRPGRLRLA